MPATYAPSEVNPYSDQPVTDLAITLFQEHWLTMELAGGLLITAAWMRPEMVVMALALSTLILACMFLFCWSHDDKYRFTRVAVLAGGLLYVPMLIMPALNFSIHEQLLLICTAAGSDTVAYFFGMRFGKH